MKIAAQESLAPGDTIGQRLAQLASFGFEAVELHSAAVEAISEVRAALADSPVVALSLCGRREHDLVVDAYTQRRRVQVVERVLEGCAELGVKAFISVPVRGPLPEAVQAQDQLDAYVRGLELLAPRAEATGVTITVEPLIRYETHLINSLADAVAVAQRVDSPAVRVMADFFHMNTEEDDIPTSIQAAGDWIAHVHLADSNRLQPGTGHIDFVAGFRALHAAGYDGALALECRLRGDPTQALPDCAAYLAQVRTEARA
jgi:sugar phosphate isomerase/epimerase